MAKIIEECWHFFRLCFFFFHSHLGVWFSADDKWYANKRWELTGATAWILKIMCDRLVIPPDRIIFFFHFLKKREKQPTATVASFNLNKIEAKKKQMKINTFVWFHLDFFFQCFLFYFKGVWKLSTLSIYLDQVTVLFNHYPLWLDDVWP